MLRLKTSVGVYRFLFTLGAVATVESLKDNISPFVSLSMVGMSWFALYNETGSHVGRFNPSDVGVDSSTGNPYL